MAPIKEIRKYCVCVWCDRPIQCSHIIYKKNRIIKIISITCIQTKNVLVLAITNKYVYA